MTDAPVLGLPCWVAVVRHAGESAGVEKLLVDMVTMEGAF
jgi:hypothetical protein